MAKKKPLPRVPLVWAYVPGRANLVIVLYNDESYREIFLSTIQLPKLSTDAEVYMAALQLADQSKLIREWTEHTTDMLVSCGDISVTKVATVMATTHAARGNSAFTITEFFFLFPTAQRGLDGKELYSTLDDIQKGLTVLYPSGIYDWDARYTVHSLYRCERCQLFPNTPLWYGKEGRMTFVQDTINPTVEWDG